MGDRLSTAVSLRGVSKNFGGMRVIERLSLDVPSGAFVSLIGPSGCGKSTLLNLMANLAAPSEGNLTWWGDGFDAVGDAGRRLAFVFQDATLMPWADVARNVRLPLDLEGMRRDEAAARVGKSLSRVGLTEQASSKPHQLSGGMRMRVSIARALVTNPNLLLMDEPFGALDEITRNRLDEDLLALAVEQKLTTIFVTHSIYEAAFLSTHVVVMASRPGRIFADHEIDEPLPRDARFRASETFATHCRALSALLMEASRESRTEAS